MRPIVATEEIKEQIITMRKAGKPLVDIAAEVGLSRSYVNNICLAAGLKTRKWERRITADQEARVEELVRLLLHGTTEPAIRRVGYLLEEMVEAGDGGAFYSDGNVGLHFKPTEIEIVDTRTGSIASLQLRLKAK